MEESNKTNIARLFLTPQGIDEKIEHEGELTDKQVAGVNSLNPLTKEFQRVRYLLQASLPEYLVHDDISIWDLKSPAVQAEYEEESSNKLELDSWVAVEDLGSSVSPSYSYAFSSIDASHGLKFTTGNVPMDDAGTNGMKQFVLCKIATGRSLPIETESAIQISPPPGYHSYYVVPPPSYTARNSNYYHEYILMNSKQILPQFLVRFSYSALEHKSQSICALCEKETATVVCRACEAELCAACDTEVHSANKLVGKHKRASIYGAKADDGLLAQVPCRLHEGKNVEFYCPQCAIPVCVHCKMVGDHSCGERGSHRLTSLAEAYEQSLKDSSKSDPLVDARRQLIEAKQKQIQERVADIQANVADVDSHIRSSMEAALDQLQLEAKTKLDLLKTEELELQRQLQHIEWTDAFLASQRKHLAPIDFLSAWNQHKPLRIEEREFPVVHLASPESVKPDIQVLGRLQIVAGDEGGIDLSEHHHDELHLGSSGHVMSPKGKKIIQEVKNDLIKTAAKSPQKAGQYDTKKDTNSITTSQRNSTTSNIQRQDVWSTQLRKEIGQDEAKPSIET